MPTLAPRNIRLTHPRRRSIKAKAVAAVLGSLLLHAVLLLVLGWVVPHWPHAKLHGNPPPLRVTFMPTKAAEPSGPSATGTPRPEYIRTLEEQQAAKPPEQPAFISDKDTAAATEMPATGDKPLPSQEGQKIPSFDFDTRAYRPGKVAQDAASMAAPAPAPDRPKAPDAKKPVAHDKKLFAAKPPPAPKTAGELASVQPDTTPPPEPPTPTTPPDESNAPPPPQDSRPVTSNPSVNSRGLPHPPGYQPQTIKSKVSGSISNRGIAAPSALGTPLGRYEKTVEDAIGMVWYQYTEQHMDVLGAGDIKLHFFVTKSGRVESVRVSSGKANGVLADISIQAVNEAPIPPIPPDIAQTLDGGRLEYDFGFGVY